VEAVLDINLKAPSSTRYRKSIFEVPTKPVTSTGLFVLKSADNNKKIGKLMLKSRWKGFPIYSLTLTERETCWAGCQNLDRCYGDNMPFARRYKTGVELERAIEADLATLQKRKPLGFLVRLHVLGDFYSIEYVQFWSDMIAKFPALVVYGYTHYRHHSDIGRAVSELVERWPARASFLRSDATEEDDPLPRAMTVMRGASQVEGTVFCPEQTGRAESCGACGLCMGGRVSVTFIDHSRDINHPDPLGL
jgi:hypothetical protein